MLPTPISLLNGFTLTSVSIPNAYTVIAADVIGSADFGYQQQDASIGDFVFNDFNGNGLFDAGELGINGVSVDLIADTNGNGVIDGGEPGFSLSINC